MSEDKNNKICLTGFMACGKSTVGRCLASRLGWRFLDLDALIVEREGKSIPEIFLEGEAVFRQKEYEALVEALDGAKGEKLVIALGGGAFAQGKTREYALEHSLTVFIDVPYEIIKARLGASDPTRPLSAKSEKLYYERQESYSRADITVDGTCGTPDRLAEIIALCLEARRP